MPERRQLPHRNGRAVSRSRRPVGAGGVRHTETVPTAVPPAPPILGPGEPSILGFPAEIPDDDTSLEPEPPRSAEPSDVDGGLYVLPAADAYAGSLLMVAGAAGGMSLFLPWMQHDRELGLALVERGVGAAGVEQLLRSGLLLPLAVAVGGGVLFVLGLLAFRPARSHRLVGVLALLVALSVAAGIVVRVAVLGWGPLRTDPGILCAVVLAGAGALGALKAMLTPPELTTDPR